MLPNLQVIPGDFPGKTLKRTPMMHLWFQETPVIGGEGVDMDGGVSEVPPPGSIMWLVTYLLVKKPSAGKKNPD